MYFKERNYEKNVLFLLLHSGTFLPIKCTSAFCQESCYFVLPSLSLWGRNIFLFNFVDKCFPFIW